ncbi:hypothetical protein RCO48_17995 [Peribacillus frigoritolerans]|nr:hypothetical protein [Peribacillus frigoritolerans]
MSSSYRDIPYCPNPRLSLFSAQNVLCISEINITTDEVRAFGNRLISNGVPVSNGEAIREDGLNFMGEHEAGFVFTFRSKETALDFLG